MVSVSRILFIIMLYYLYTQLLFSLPNNFLSSIRKLENIKKKLCKAEWSQHFNNVCLQVNIMKKKNLLYQKRDTEIKDMITIS